MTRNLNRRSTPPGITTVPGLQQITVMPKINVLKWLVAIMFLCGVQSVWAQSYSLSTAGIYFPEPMFFPTYEIIDEDDYSSPIPIGFDFTFYGNVYNTLYINQNGYISFTGPAVGFEDTYFSQLIHNPDDPSNLTPGLCP